MTYKRLGVLNGFLAIAMLFGCGSRTVASPDGGGGGDAGPVLVYTLAVNTTGTGEVVLVPAGGSYISGTQVLIMAKNTPPWKFDHWAGDVTGTSNPATIVMNSDKIVTAVFTQTAPTPGNYGELKKGESQNQFTSIKWAAAMDQVTSKEDLQYRLYYSTSDNIDTVENAEANGTPVGDWAKDINTKPVVTLLPLTKYYFNVLVKNNADLKAAYQMMGTTTGNTRMPSFNNYVSSMVLKEKTIYAAGFFDSVSKQTGGGTIVDNVTGNSTPAGSYPVNVDGNVYTAIQDGKGGWFIGGDWFWAVNGRPLYFLAHISADGLLYDWFPEPDSGVFALALSADGTTLYVGGDFNSIGGAYRSFLAAIDVETGIATAWNPDANNHVHSMALSPGGDLLYAGGDFSAIGGMPRNRLASIGTSDGYATDWNPDADDVVNTLALSNNGSTLYVGGVFTQFGGITGRNHIASFNTSSGSLNDWNPDADGNVNALAVSPDGTALYIGGGFQNIGSEARNYIAAFETTGGTLKNWIPDADNTVRVIALSHDGSVVYAGGDFHNVGGEKRSYIAAVNASDAHASSWAPDTDNVVRAVSASPDGSKIFIGGNFQTVKLATRGGLAAIDIETGLPSSWNPIDPDDPFWSGVGVIALSHDGSTLYAGGAFAQIGTVSRWRLASFDLASGALTAWDPHMNDDVNAIVVGADKVYVGGAFTEAGDPAVTRNRVAAYNSVTGALEDWHPDVNGKVWTMALGAGRIFIGGEFTQIDGNADYNKLASFDISNGQLTSWTPNPNDKVFEITVADRIYAGGAFTQLGTATVRNHIAAFVSATGAIDDGWNPNADGSVAEISVSPADGTIFAGGAFGNVGGNIRKNIASLAVSDGTPLHWMPEFNGPVQAMVISPDGRTVYAGGLFDTVDNKARMTFVSVDTVTGEVW